MMKINPELNHLMDKLLLEMDPDICSAMRYSNGEYPAWYYIPDPMRTAIEWQALREMKKK